MKLPFVLHGSSILFLSALASLSINSAGAALVRVTRPGDAITVDASNSPAGEDASKAIDDSIFTRYVHFNVTQAAFNVTPSVGATTLKAFRLATASDLAGRDPIRVTISGSNDGTTFTPIVANSLTGLEADPGRRTYGPVVNVANAVSYTSYRIEFVELRDSAEVTLQVSEVQLLAESAGPEQTGSTFTVNTTSGHNDTACTTDDCSLPEAVNAANAAADANTIQFGAGLTGTIAVALNRNGMPITNPVTIVGPSAKALTVSGAGVSRIFNITAANVSISGLSFTSGVAFAAGGGVLPIGGAILNTRGALTVTDCAFSGNTGLHGGAIYSTGANGSATLTAANCTFNANSVSGVGGAILISGSFGQASGSFTNCTFHQNFANQYGGGLYNDATNGGTSSVTLTNCTFNENTAGVDGSGILTDGVNPGSTGTATVTMRNNIFRAAGTNAFFFNDGGAFTSQGSNISSDAAGGDAGTGPGGFLGATGDRRNTDPLLDPAGLADNGGMTFTVALQASSPAINTGNDAFAPQFDQRGYLRAGVSDVGAFEFNGTPAGPVILQSAVSRKTHTGIGDFDINLPLTGNPGIECRTAAGTHLVVFTFATPISSVGSVDVTSGTGSVSASGVGADPRQFEVTLTGVANAQVITITLTNVNDAPGNHSDTISVRMGVLFGDTNGDRSTNAGDALQTKTRSGQATNATNFRSDVNIDGNVNAGDAFVVRARSGTYIP